MRDRDLIKRTKVFALEVIELSTLLPNDPRGWILGKQVLRSGTSVGANYNEAQRSRSRPEFNSKIHICQQELEETIYWLELIRLASLIQEDRLISICKEAQELRAILIAISNSTSAS